MSHEIDHSGSPDRPVRHEGLAGLSWMSFSELDWMIERLPERGLYLEIGTASGVSASKIALARPGLHVLCLDVFVDADKPHVAEGEPDRLANWRANRRDNMTLWYGRLAHLVEFAPGLKADAILVDAGHDEPDVWADLELASTLLHPGGVLYAHDCNEPALPGVTAAVDRFQRERGWVTLGQHWTLRAMGKA